MKNLKIIVVMLFVTISSIAQQKLEKISQSINVNDDVVIDLNTSYTDIEIDTWNKDIIEIEAYMESDKLSKDELQKVFDNWKVLVDGSKESVVIESGGSLNSWSNSLVLFDDHSLDALKELEIRLADIPEIPILESLAVVEWNFEDMPKIPNLPDLPEGMNNFNFDYDQYKEEGEEYLERWSREYEDKYGKEYSVKMEAWAKEFDEKDWAKFEEQMEAWGEKFGEEFGEKFGEDMEKWGEEFGKKMEAWGEEFEQKLEESGFEEKMEAWGEELGERIEKQLEAHGEIEHEGLFHNSGKSNLKVKKTIKIKMPKKAKLKMNVRHGELKFASVINNLKADISHSNFIANNIDGGETSINVSYSPVKITNWNAGELKLNYVDNAQIETANKIVLSSNSSNVNIKSILNNAIIDGSFGDLVIGNISNSFRNINLVLENSDANLKLPKENYSLFYKGFRSIFNDDSTTSKTINNYPGNSDTNQTIVINAKYSNVVTQ